MRTIFRTLRWFTFAAFLVGLGWVIYQVLPPQPRWRVVLDERFSHLARTNWDLARGTVSFRSSGDFRGAVTVLDANYGRQLKKLGAPAEGCGTELKFSPCGRFAVVLEADQDVVGWLDLVGGKREAQQLVEHKDIFPHLDFSPSGAYFAIRLIPESRDEEIRYRLAVFRTGTREKLLDVPLAEFFRDFEPFVPGEEKLILFPEGTNLIIWDLEARKEVGRVQDAAWPVRCSPDGLTLCARRNSSGAVSLWSIRDRSQPKPLADSRGASSDDGHFSPDGVWWARRCADGYGIIHVPTGRQTRVPVDGFRWSFFFFSPDSSRMGFVTSADVAYFHCVEPATGRLLWRRPIHQRPQDNDYPEPPCNPVFSGDSRYVILPGPNDTYDVVRIEDGALGAQIPALIDSRWRLPPDDPERGGTAIFRLRGGTLDAQDRHDSLAWLPVWIKEYLHLAVEGPHEPATLLDLHDGVSITPWEVPVGSHLSLAPDGQSLLVASPLEPDSCTLTCWDIPFARPWRWIIGIPAGIGVSVLAWKWLRQKRRAAA